MSRLDSVVPATPSRRKPLPAKTYFDAFASHLDRRAWNAGTAPWAAWAWSVVAEEIGQTDGLIVDLGTGTGAWIMNLLALVPRARFLGIDFSEAMIECARQKDYRTADGSADVSFEVCRIGALRLPLASVDHFVSAGTFHHVKNKRRIAGRLAEMLKPGGKFINVDHFRPGRRYQAETEALRLQHPELAAENDRVRASFQWLYDDDRQHPIEFHTDPYEFAQILELNGFTETRVHVSLQPGYAVVVGCVSPEPREASR